MFASRLLFFLGLTMAMSQIAFAQNSPIKYEQLNRKLTIRYLDELVEEFNGFKNVKDLKDIYGYFTDNADRKTLFQDWKTLPHLRREGMDLIVEFAAGKTERIQVVDFLAQEYRYDGKTYFFNWLAQPAANPRMLHKVFGRESAENYDRPWLRPLDLVVPRAHAQILAGAAALGEACVEGCEAAWAMGSRAVVFVGENAPEISAAASRAGTAVAARASVVISRASQAMGRYAQYVIEDIRTDPEIGGSIDKVLRAVRAPATYVKAPFKAIGWVIKVVGQNVPGAAIGTTAGLGGGVVMYLLNQETEEAKAKNIKWQTAFNCALSLHLSLDNCPLTNARVGVAKSPPEIAGGLPQMNWCPTVNVPELQIYTTNAAGVKSVQVYRLAVPTSVAAAGGEEKSSVPTWGMRFDVDARGYVNLDSMRYYTFTNGEVTKITKPGFHQDGVWGSQITTERDKMFVGTTQSMENEMKSQIIRREKFLESMRDKSKDKVIIQGNNLNDFSLDPIKAGTAGQEQNENQELLSARQFMALQKVGAKICSQLIDDSSEQKKEAAAIPTDTKPASTQK